MKVAREVEARLARESGQWLGELGVVPADKKWIRAQAQTLASLWRGPALPKRGLLDQLRRWARRAARAAR